MDQELIQSDATARPQNGKGKNHIQTLRTHYKELNEDSGHSATSVEIKLICLVNESTDLDSQKK